MSCRIPGFRRPGRPGWSAGSSCAIGRADLRRGEWIGGDDSGVVEQLTENIRVVRVVGVEPLAVAIAIRCGKHVRVDLWSRRPDRSARTVAPALATESAAFWATRWWAYALPPSRMSETPPMRATIARAAMTMIWPRWPGWSARRCRASRCMVTSWLWRGSTRCLMVASDRGQLSGTRCSGTGTRRSARDFAVNVTPFPKRMLLINGVIGR